MNIDQLRMVLQIIKSGFNLSVAASTLDRSQSGLSRAVQELEDEVQYRIFARSKNRLSGLTEQGTALVTICERMVSDADSLRLIGRQDLEDSSVSLRIATTHINAKYLLPRVVREFTLRFPKVRLLFRQGTADQCCDLVSANEADVAVTTFPNKLSEKIVAVPIYSLPRSVIVPVRHPLIDVKSLTYERMAQFPMITYSQTDPGRNEIGEIFSRNGISPHFACSGLDADICKMYVGLGVGIAVLIRLVVDARHDKSIVALDADKLFDPLTLGLVFRRHTYITPQLRAFNELFAPHVEARIVRAAIETGKVPLGLRPKIKVSSDT